MGNLKKKEGFDMSVQLLDKTRKINKLLHNNNSHMVVFNDICEVLSEILESNILVISRKGKVLGIKNRPDFAELHELIVDAVFSILIIQFSRSSLVTFFFSFLLSLPFRSQLRYLHHP